MENFIIDPEFRDKIPPLSAEELSKLEENILADGEVREPLVLWNNTVIDGHHRWKIIQAHPEIPYKVKRMEFPDKWAAIVWMCRNQLGRRNLTEEQKSYLRGKQYDAEKLSQGGDRKSENFSSGQDARLKSRREIKDGTAGMVGKEHGVNGRTIRRDSEFASGLDAAEQAHPGIRGSVLSGQVKAPKNLISEIRNMPEERRWEAVETIKQGDIDTAKAIIKANTPAAKKASNDRPQEDAPKDDREAYNADDFRAALMAAVNTFDFTLDQHMVQVHLDILRSKEGKSAAEAALMMAKEVIKKYFRLIDGVVLEENKNGKED